MAKIPCSHLANPLLFARNIGKRFVRMRAAQFGRDERGAIIVIFALMLPIIVGFVGLGLDVGLWYSTKRNLQGAADTAAVSAAYELGAGNSLSAIQTAALIDAKRNGLNAGVAACNGVATSAGSCTVNVPPTSGTYSGDSSAVEVILNEPQNLLFASVISNFSLSISSRAVAISGGDSDACMLTLNKTVQKALEFSGNSAINAAGCIVASNSSHDSSIEITGSASVTADSLSTAGDYLVNGAALLDTVTAPKTYAAEIQDPYASLDVPAYSGCDKTEYKSTPGSNVTITPSSATTPYVFCKGLDVKGTLKFMPGIYVIDGGTFNLNATAALSGTGVTFILTSSSGSNYAKYTMNGSASINLSAPTSGDYSGILMYADRNGPNQVNTLNGNAAATFNGALYFPSSELNFAGNSSSGGSSCTQLIADTIKVTGGTDITTSGCVSAGATLATVSDTQLVE